MHKVLIVEDEQSIAMLLEYNLQKANFSTEIATNGKQALTMLNTKQYDFVILDLMLPEIGGLEICRIVRENGNDVPILMLTAKTDEETKIAGLNIGADDYITKPFSVKELVARIEAILRRTNRKTKQHKENEKLAFGNITVFPKQYKAYRGEKLLELTKKEFELLTFLIVHKDKIFSRENLLHAVWGYEFVGDTRSVDMLISRLRDKIEVDSKKPQYIKTVWGLGYKMEEPQ